MGDQDPLRDIPQEGFIKLTRDPGPLLSREQKAHLNRKGNEFFGAGSIEEAKRIFVTTGYSDGMIRVGEHYEKKGEPYLALQMYKLAPSPQRISRLAEKMAQVIRRWIEEQDNG